MSVQKVDDIISGAYDGVESLLLYLKGTGKKYDIEKIKKAYLYAKELHAGQYRVSGEEYISHPVAVASIAASLELDTDSICAALLHDTVEDCGSKTDIPTLTKLFGEDVAQLVDGLTKMVQIPFEDKEEQHVENLRKMFLAMAKDVRVIFIKLCDRLHNMRTLDAKPENKRRMTAHETMQVFAPLAHRLGMQKMKHELENRSLAYLDPIGYDEIKELNEKRYGENRNFLEKARSRISDKLSEAGLKFTLEGRVKYVYSIYRKMYQQNKSFDEVFDFYALRVIVDTEEECYLVLGLIHDMFNMIPGRFKDYISTPKPNMYRSLHTTVIGRSAIPFEVQIRTWEMHRIAEYGVAAHWKYKSGGESKAEIDRKLSWIAKLIETEDDTRDPEEFMQALKIDIMHDDVFIFTPKGDIITLPQGATVIDFAYAIHSEVGNKMVGAKINGMIVPIDRAPQNGEIVEVITSSASRGPSRDWLKIVKTGEARNKIRQWFKREQRSENISVGKSEIEKIFRKMGRAYTDEQRDEILSNVGRRIGIIDIDDLYNTVGYGGITVAKLATKLRDEFDRIVKVSEETPQSAEDVATVTHKSSNGGVIVDGVDGLSVKFSRCCNPLPGDPIIGFITKGYGISIHKQDCRNVMLGLSDESQRNRFVNARWENTGAQSRSEFEALIRVVAQQGIRLIADLTMVLADMRVSLLNIATRSRAGGVVVELTVACRNLDHFKSIMARLRAVENVEDVSRGYMQ